VRSRFALRQNSSAKRHEPTAGALNEREALEQFDGFRALTAGLVRDSSRVDDLVKQTWLAAQSRPATLGGPGGVLARLAAVLRNRARRPRAPSAAATSRVSVHIGRCAFRAPRQRWQWVEALRSLEFQRVFSTA
jgi:DNA-directed RNA polymerase specialized sigma24 family protein